MTGTDPLSREAITEEAALWYSKLDLGTADPKAFETWRAANPLHAVAFARISAAADAIDAIRHIDVSDGGSEGPASINRRRLLTWTGASAATAAGATFLIVSQARSHAKTAIGGRQTIPMPDGGRLDVNTDSKVAWKFTHAQRELWLERGEVALTVPKDVRPFKIFAGDQHIVLQQGDFNIRLRGNAVDVTVLAGTCLVASKDADALSPGPQRVSQGEAVFANVSDLQLRKLKPEDVQFTQGWRRDELVFDGQTLGVAVGEYNRYLENKIVITDSTLSAVTLGGRFNTHDPKDFLSALQSSFAIKVSKSASGMTLLSR